MGKRIPHRWNMYIHLPIFSYFINHFETKNLPYLGRLNAYIFQSSPLFGEMALFIGVFWDKTWYDHPWHKNSKRPILPVFLSFSQVYQHQSYSLLNEKH